MTIANWISIGTLLVELVKTAIPFGFLLVIFLIFKKELKIFIKTGGWKVTAPGVSLEAHPKQQLDVSKKEKKEIQALNEELNTTKERELKLKELQENTSKQMDTYFLGYHFEKTYRLIFPSQMALLNQMQKGNGNLPEMLIKAFFQRTIWSQKYNVTYEQFIGFLEASGLVEVKPKDGVVSISALGKTFLQYLTNNNISFKLPANDYVDVDKNNGDIS